MSDRKGCIYKREDDDNNLYCLISFDGGNCQWRKFCPNEFNNYYNSIYYVDVSGRVTDPEANGIRATVPTTNGVQSSMVDPYHPDDLVTIRMRHMSIFVDSRFTPVQGDLWVNDTDRTPYAFDVSSYNPRNGTIIIIPIKMNDPHGYPYFQKSTVIGSRPFERNMEDTTFWILVGLGKIKLYRPPRPLIQINDSFRVKVSHKNIKITNVTGLMFEYHYDDEYYEVFTTCTMWVLILLLDVSGRGLLENTRCATPPQFPATHTQFPMWV